MNGLILKEWKLSKKMLWQNFATIMLLWITGFGASLYWKQPEISLGVGILLISTHLFYVAVDISVSLYRDTKSMIWLHNPNSAYALLSSKLLVSLITSLISLVITIGLVFLSGVLLKGEDLMNFEAAETSIFIFSIAIIGVYLGFWMTFIFVFIKSVANKGIAGKTIQILIVILTWPVIQLHQYFHDSLMYQKLLMIVVFPFPTIGTKTEEYGFSFGLDIGEFSLGLIGFYGMVCVGLFMLSTWFIEKKMEM